MRRYVFGTTTHDAEVQHGAPEWFYIFITWDVYTVYVYIRFFFRTHRTIITYTHKTRIILQYAQKKYTCYNNNTRRYTPSSRFFRATRKVHHGAIFFFCFVFLVKCIAGAGGSAAGKRGACEGGNCYRRVVMASGWKVCHAYNTSETEKTRRGNGRREWERHV